MIDQHLIELQLLKSAARVSKAKMKKQKSHSLSMMNGAIEPECEADDTATRSLCDDHDNAEASRNTVNEDTAAVLLDLKRTRTGRRALSNVDLRSQSHTTRIRRRPSHIDRRRGQKRLPSPLMTFGRASVEMFPSSAVVSLNVLLQEVIKALQSTFGGKLDEIRSRNHPAPTAAPPSASRQPSPPLPLQPSSSSPPASPAPSPSRPPPAVDPTQDIFTFLQRLAAREGAYMLLAYFSAVLLAWFVLSVVNRDDDDDGSSRPKVLVNEGSNVNAGPCLELADGPYDSSCARLFGYILPAATLAIFFSIALALFMLDVSFNLFDVLMLIDSYIAAKRTPLPSPLSSSKIHRPQSPNEENKVPVRPATTTWQVLLFPFAINISFSIPPSVLLWISKTATTDPIGTVCEQKLQLFWMLGLAILGGVILWRAVQSFTDPLDSKLHMRLAAKRVVIILCALLLCTVYFRARQRQVGLPCRRGPAAAQDSFNSTYTMVGVNECQPSHKEWGRCRDDGKRSVQLDFGHGECWRPFMHHTHREHEWCDVNFTKQCDWPGAKRIQPFQRTDQCLLGFPQCEWTAAKQVQIYVQHGWSRAPNCNSNFGCCEWPWSKQLQLYESKGYSQLPNQCTWPWMKQVQLFKINSELHGYNHFPVVCEWSSEWSWMKQVQPRVQRVKVSELEGFDEYPKLLVCEWPWMKQVQPVNLGVSQELAGSKECGQECE